MYVYVELALTLLYQVLDIAQVWKARLSALRTRLIILFGLNTKGGKEIQVCTLLHTGVVICLLTTRDIDLVYPNGLSNSLPVDVQLEMLRSVPGLDKVEIVRPAYGVEYDFVDPRELHCASWYSSGSLHAN